MTELLDTIRTEITERRQELAPLVREHEVLQHLLAALDQLEAPAPPPRRRRRARRAVPLDQLAVKPPRSSRAEVRIGVLSQTHPTPAELADRELAYTTESP